MCDAIAIPTSSTEPQRSFVNGDTARKKGEAAGKKPEEVHLHVLDSHQRLNFLHQGAIHLSHQSVGLDDVYAKLARRYTKHLRDVLKTERVKVSPDINQTFCRKCKQVFVAKVERCELNLIQKRVLQRKCALCGYCRNYQWNTDYLTRNQKYLAKQFDANTREGVS